MLVYQRVTIQPGASRGRRDADPQTAAARSGSAGASTTSEVPGRPAGYWVKRRQVRQHTRNHHLVMKMVEIW
jgi:hypothetical protein